MFGGLLSRWIMPHNVAGVVVVIWASEWDAIIVSPILVARMLVSRVWGRVLRVLVLLL